MKTCASYGASDVHEVSLPLTHESFEYLSAIVAGVGNAIKVGKVFVEKM